MQSNNSLLIGGTVGNWNITASSYKRAAPLMGAQV
jgi:hypothetical protein